MRIHAIPLELSAANEFVAKLHRHHAPVYRDKFRIGAVVDGKLVGVVQVGRPVSRNLDDGKTVEVVRLCTDGTKDVCSFLYAKAARIAKEMGYEKNHNLYPRKRERRFLESRRMGARIDYKRW